MFPEAQGRGQGADTVQEKLLIHVQSTKTHNSKPSGIEVFSIYVYVQNTK
ncbi:hypothetical protein E2C01_052245 [Portunus trituberculatus]|uniref:Uncharacterized protein n=1 Tax=Portunus trituberculatus TaxID=210409 RepID=A0A5B7GL17_PORTR|nr:hypothetical protein [Portunus trituberculatus]